MTLWVFCALDETRQILWILILLQKYSRARKIVVSYLAWLDSHLSPRKVCSIPFFTSHRHFHFRKLLHFRCSKRVLKSKNVGLKVLHSDVHFESHYTFLKSPVSSVIVVQSWQIRSWKMSKVLRCTPRHSSPKTCICYAILTCRVHVEAKLDILHIVLTHVAHFWPWLCSVILIIEYTFSALYSPYSWLKNQAFKDVLFP